MKLIIGNWRASVVLGLLAPVPEVHLVSGIEVCGREGMVAFGSTNWEIFRRLDELLGSQYCQCLIYASHSSYHSLRPTVTWKGTYVDSVESRGGAHPDGMKYRPESTTHNPSDNRGHWAVFWHITNLEQLSPTDGIEIGSLRGYEKPKRYLTNFRPEGPLLIDLE